MEKKENIISKIAYYSFYAGIIIEVLLVIIDKSAYINPVEGQIFRLTFLLFLFKVCLTRYSWKEYLTIFLFGMLGAISYFVTGRNEIVRLVIMIAACKDINMKRCLKLVFLMILSGCLFLILLSVTGIYGTIALTQDYGRGGEETRYTLGMGHPNALHCMVWALITLFLYLYAEKIKWYGYLLLIIINTIFFCLTDSKTSFLVTAVIITYTAIFKYLKNDFLKRICMYLGCLASIGSILLSVIIAANAYQVYNYVWYNDRSFWAVFFQKLNNAINGRIRILVETDGFEGAVSSWRLFSTPTSNYLFDMGWVRLFYWYGIIPACIFIAVLILLMVCCLKKKDYMAVSLIFSFAVYNVIEAHAISVYLARNYLFFLIGYYWYQLPVLQGKREWYIWRWKTKDAILQDIGNEH